jgi:hypothetical protein
MLIGAGGNGDGTSGGGSGAVTVWYGAAQHVPNLVYIVSTGQGSQHPSQIYFDSGQVYILLQAEPGSAATGGAATSAPAFAASGFYKSTAGQDGSSVAVTPSNTTFLSGGGVVTQPVTANYGYALLSPSINKNGMFQMQPIIVGLGSKDDAQGAIGCGGGRTSGVGGPGMVLIASW